MLGDNENLITSFSISSNTLRKNHNSIAYHQVRLDVAASVISLVHIPEKSNPDNLLTKPLGTQNNYPLMKEFISTSISELKRVSES